MRYLLDTNVISEQTKPLPNAGVIRRWELDSIFACTSATVWHELWYGVNLLDEGKRKQGLVGALEILKASGLPILPFCEQAAEWLALERVRLKRLGLTPPKYDSEIAAVAVVNNLILVTRNVDDFVMFRGLQVENWFESVR